MLPPELKCFVDDLTKQFRFFLEADSEGVDLPELLSAEQQVNAFVRQLGPDMLETFVTVRVASPRPVETDRPQHTPRCASTVSLSKGEAPIAARFRPLTVPLPAGEGGNPFWGPLIRNADRQMLEHHK